MRYAAEDEEEPPQLRRLRQMVMVLLVVLMLGIVTIAATIVIRLGLGGDGATPVTAASLTLPSDHQIVATGRGPGEVHVTMLAPDGTEVLIVLDEASGAELSRTLIIRE